MLLPVQGAAAARFEVVDFRWTGRLTYTEANSQADPVNIQGEQGETVTRFRYRPDDDFVRTGRRSVFATDQNYTVRSTANWREDQGDGFEAMSCRDTDELDGGGGVAFKRRRSRVRLEWNLPIALSNCGPGVFDDRRLDDALEAGTTQIVAASRFNTARIRVGIKGKQPLRSSDGAVRGNLVWSATIKLIQR